MKYEKSLKEIKKHLEEYNNEFIDMQRSLLATMEEIDKDIGFALENKDIDHASFLQTIFNELEQLANGLNPIAFKQMHFVIELIDEHMKEREHGEEHKATTEA